MNPQDVKLGILGGGQLARMMLTPCLDWDLNVAILDGENSVCKDFCSDFRLGNFNDAKEVEDLFNDRDIVTLDLEGVSLDGLKRLEKNGVQVAPSSAVLSIIQNKIKQKDFFKDHGIPTSKYKVIEELSDRDEIGFLKVPSGGYDGKGVFHYKGDLSKVPEEFKKNVLWEEPIAVEKEISVLVVRNSFGEVKTYPSTEMAFDPQLNLISYTLFPARLSASLEEKAKHLAVEVCEKLNCVGVLAVEMFLTKDGDILVNECAPRPHNSGHHTIESCQTSQFENHIRGVIGLPLGSTEGLGFGLTFNLIGEGQGKAKVIGLEELMARPGVSFHLYGKKECRVGRKMGHVTITGRSHQECIDRFHQLHKKIRIVGEDE